MNAQHRLAQALAAVEARLEGDPRAIALRFERAGLLAALGQTERAKQCYLENSAPGSDAFRHAK